MACKPTVTVKSQIQGVLTVSSMIRATKSQNFSAVSKVYETSTNQISRSYHEGIPSY